MPGTARRAGSRSDRGAPGGRPVPGDRRDRRAGAGTGQRACPRRTRGTAVAVEAVARAACRNRRPAIVGEGASAGTGRAGRTARRPCRAASRSRRPSATSWRAWTADLLDQLLNNAGEVSIFRARVEQQMASVEFNLAELGRTVTRLREQLRKLEMETEAQILLQAPDRRRHRADFDPLELDRYSTIQQLSRALAESASDVGEHRGPAREPESRGAEPAAAAGAHGHRAAERPDAHAHGAVPAARAAAHAPGAAGRAGGGQAGRARGRGRLAANSTARCSSACCRPSSTCCATPSCTASSRRERAARARQARGGPDHGEPAARGRGGASSSSRTTAPASTSRRSAARRGTSACCGRTRTSPTRRRCSSILEPGFSTADRLTQQAGRGVGMDVVATEVKKLGGGLFIESDPGRGHALHDPPAVHARDHPGADRARARRVLRAAAGHRRGRGAPAREPRSSGTCRGAADLRVRRPALPLPAPRRFPRRRPVRAARDATRRCRWCWCAPASIPTALVTDELVGSREIVVKSVGPQIASIRGISGATILGDGRIVIILDMGALVRSEWRGRARPRPPCGQRATTASSPWWWTTRSPCAA